MKLFELLMETPQEDKVLIQLARTINSELSNSKGKKNPGNVSNYISKLPSNMQNILGNSFDNVRVELKSVKAIAKFLNSTGSNSMAQDYGNNRTVGLWHPDGSPDDQEANSNSPSGTIILNREDVGTTEFISTLSHELRHALDDAKSKMGAADSKRYNSPRKKEHQNDEFGYMAQPAEINARFVQAMEAISRAIPIIYKLPEDKIRPRIKRAIDQSFENNSIADLFPEKARSKDYRRLMKRALSFAQNEMSELEQVLAQQGRPKQATGNW